MGVTILHISLELHFRYFIKLFLSYFGTDFAQHFTYKIKRQKMLVSNNQSTLSWNSSFSKQKQGNSNETFNLEFPSKIEIQSDTKTAKKLEVGGIEYLEFPSSNVEINSALNSSVSSATAVSQTTAVSQATAVSQTATTTTAYGYSVDSKGFMGADFNNAAGISDNVKLHSKTIEQLTTHAKNIGFNGSAVEITKKAWSNFSQIIGDESALRGEKSLAQTNIPLSFTTNGSILGQVTSVQKDITSFAGLCDACEIETLSRGQMSLGKISFDFIGLMLNGQDNESVQNTMKTRLADINDELGTSFDEFDIGAMFAILADKQMAVAPNGEFKEVANYENFKSSKQSIKDYLFSNFGVDYFESLALAFAKDFTKDRAISLFEKYLLEIKQN